MQNIFHVSVTVYDSFMGLEGVMGVGSDCESVIKVGFIGFFYFSS